MSNQLKKVIKNKNKNKKKNKNNNNNNNNNNKKTPKFVFLQENPSAR